MDNTCINCGQLTTGKFCANCGQKAGVKRITFREGWEDFWARIYGFDGMFPRTLRDLTIRPGEAAREYIGGNRAKYYGPIGYFFLMITLFLLLLDLFDMSMMEFYKKIGESSVTPQVKEGTIDAQRNTLIMSYISDNTKLFFFVIIPFQSFVSRFLLFRKSSLNYLEHSILPFYITGHALWLSIFTLIVYKISGYFINSGFSTILSMVYVGFGYANFFTYQPKWKSFLKGVLSYWVGTLAIVIFGSILLVIAMILFPSVREAFAPGV
jgi:hypothetical protein